VSSGLVFELALQCMVRVEVIGLGIGLELVLI